MRRPALLQLPGMLLSRPNLVTNPNFVTDTTGWTMVHGAVTRSTDRARIGSASGLGTFNGGGQGGPSCGVTIEAPGLYVASAYVWIDAAFSGAANIIISPGSFTGLVTVNRTRYAAVAASDAGRWRRVWVSFTVAADGTGAINLNADNGTPANGAKVYVSGLKVERGAFPSRF